MVDLYCSGTSARAVAERYGVSLRTVKRLLHDRGVRRYRPTSRKETTPNSPLPTGRRPARSVSVHRQLGGPSGYWEDRRG